LNVYIATLFLCIKFDADNFDSDVTWLMMKNIIPRFPRIIALCRGVHPLNENWCQCG
jgi:hypothetical protein